MEYEIKVTEEDWRRDRAKVKWDVSPPTGNELVSRFFYVVPGTTSKSRASCGLPVDSVGLTRGGEWLVPAIRAPGNMAPGAGVIAVYDGGWCKELVAARRRPGVAKCPEDLRRRLMDTFYYRFWRQEDVLRQVKQDRDDLWSRLGGAKKPGG